MSFLNNKFINNYSPKIAGALASIIIASALFIPSYPPTNWLKWIGLIISVLAAIFGILLSFLTLELKINIKAELIEKSKIDAFKKFKVTLQKKYRTKIKFESETKIIFTVLSKEKQFYYHLITGILDDIKAKEIIEFIVDYSEKDEYQNMNCKGGKMSNRGELIPEENKQLAYTELLNLIKNQDNLIHSWTKFLISIQAGLGIALAFLLTLSRDKSILVLIGSVLIPFLGISTMLYLVNIIVREHHWQGKVIRAFRELKAFPEIYDKDPDPNPKKHGYIARQFLRLRIILILGWLTIVLYVVTNFFLNKS